MVFGCTVYLLATEFITAKKSKGEVLLFRRGAVPDLGPTKLDEESNMDNRPNVEAVMSRTKTTPDTPANIQKQTAIFHWDSVHYDIKIKGEPRKLLDDVDGWVKPGTLTALMGVSGAGKTTLLDVLASRVTMGVVTGEMLVDGRLRDTGKPYFRARYSFELVFQCLVQHHTSKIYVPRSLLVLSSRSSNVWCSTRH